MLEVQRAAWSCGQRVGYYGVYVVFMKGAIRKLYGRLTVEDSHCLNCLWGLKIARVAAVFAHVRNHLRKLGAAGNLVIAQNGGVVGAFDNKLSGIWIDTVEEHLPADSFSQSFRAHLPVCPGSEIPAVLINFCHRGIRRSRSHGRRISGAAREIILL